tara:strand:- start:1196 stop:1756 length:561 start_codon:yes stop_codon:yes gene_type:complete
MFKSLSIIIISIFFTYAVFAAGGSGGQSGSDGSSGGGEGGGLSKYEKGYNYVMTGKSLEKKANKYLKLGKNKKAEKRFKKSKNNYEKAFKLFLKSNKEKPNDPDTLNYLGFTSRKLGDFKSAEDYYLSGLKIKPNHNGINEYLGELYLSTDRKDKALERLKVLRNCNCDEYIELKELIEGKRESKY